MVLFMTGAAKHVALGYFGIAPLGRPRPDCASFFFFGITVMKVEIVLRPTTDTGLIGEPCGPPFCYPLLLILALILSQVSFGCVHFRHLQRASDVQNLGFFGPRSDNLIIWDWLSY